MKHKMTTISRHDKIEFLCKACGFSVLIHRPVWFLIAVKKDKRLAKMRWQECQGH